jgi:cytochrome c biogenesis protein CcdA
MGLIGLDARLATSFTAGLLAAINPCGFVLLPAYLAYFLGMEQGATSQRASLRRALLVSLAVSAGFLAVFLVVGVIVKNSTNWLVEKAPWVALMIGAGLVVLGIAMVFGYRLPFTVAKLDAGGRDRTVRSMFVFGCAYAIASVGCSAPIFLSVVLGAVSTDGLAKGIAAIALYGIGMAIIVTALTVTLAFANRGLLRVLRQGMRWVEPAAGIVVLLTGAYLMWYWYHGIRKEDYGSAVGRAVGWQDRLSTWVQAHQSGVVTVSVAVIVVAVGIVLLRPLRGRSDRHGASRSIDQPSSAR